MKISILQPMIERGNISKNASIIQNLVNNASGDLLILAEYALTGSLVLEKNVNIYKWATESETALQNLQVPNGKKLLINSLFSKENKIYNACTLLPSGEIAQIKTYLDAIEIDAEIYPGNGISIFQIDDKKMVIIICSDLKEIDNISTEGADIILFIFHFTSRNHGNVMSEIVSISKERNLPILTASLSSDKNNGHSCYVFGTTIVSLGNEAGILEVTI